MLRKISAIIFLLATVAAGFFCSNIANSQTIESSSQTGIKGWRTNFAKRSIDLNELIAGGPPKDGIPAITGPKFTAIAEASRWIEPEEPVISVVIGTEQRAYPLQILIWHEIANDSIAGISVIVTFCPLCYSAIVFNRTVNGKEYTFGVSGMLRHSDMVMYDRETESFWQQITGEAIVGDLTGTKLKQLPTQIISFKQFFTAYKNGTVMSRDTGFSRDYGRNPYAGYDDVSQAPFLLRDKPDERLAPMEKVIALSINKDTKAYPYTITRKVHVINDKVDGQAIVIFHSTGAVSALNHVEIRASREDGSTGVFNPSVEDRGLTFRYADGKFIDRETESIWDITGLAVAGKLKGKRLLPIVHGDYFAFAWLAFKPETKIYGSN